MRSFLWAKTLPKYNKHITVHDVLEPLKQALLASHDVIIASQICGSKLRRDFTLGDGCWLPKIEPSCRGNSANKEEASEAFARERTQ